VKVKISICELAGAYSKIKVSAEIMFPPESYDSLKSKEGSSLAISGQLIAQDSMLNMLFVVSE
jgi:hypothetical protein